MPKRTDLRKILVIGSGPIVIGQACEFDYSGTQACKALRAEGYEVVLINSNPATIMTDPEMADGTYIEPLTLEAVTAVLERERPDALLPTVGGQTALNLAMQLAQTGVLDRLGVQLIGANIAAIELAESRRQFKAAMEDIGLEMTKAMFVTPETNLEEVRAAIGYPAIVRPSFTLGGAGGGIAYNDEEFYQIVERGLALSPVHEVVVEESVLGWKEYELEVMRDAADNIVIVCSIENFDPMGIHTGDSITVAPAQTLTDREYQTLRDASLNIIRRIGVETGGSNIQFAVNPKDGRIRVIEMNPRVSRSSALASKATGFPIAKIAAKLAVGYTLDEIPNDITRKTPASFEPTLDYVVVKIPKWAFEKFQAAEPVLGTQMKSVGEAMAIGRTFKEAFMKALRSLEASAARVPTYTNDDDLRRHLITPNPERVRYLQMALERGWSCAELHELTAIDPWFLHQLKEIADAQNALRGRTLEDIPDAELRHVKRLGFSDRRVARTVGCTEADVRARRMRSGIRPVFKRIDTCAAEFASHTPYLYSTYEEECEAEPTSRRKIVILGSGPNRIGQGIEFDYCCCHASFALQEAGYETIMVNCNPETVSTDYDTSDKLYFEPVTVEDVLAIYEKEKPVGVVIQFGGQTPLNIARELAEAGVKILGTSPDAIDLAEDRDRFRKRMEALGIPMPESGMASTLEEALDVAKRIGYPLMVRPSYVLGGRGMEVVHDEGMLREYVLAAVGVTPDRPILIDRFLEDAIEAEADALADRIDAFVPAVMEHIERAGIHSGDSACVIPPISIPARHLETIREYTRKIAVELGVVGLMNIQYAIAKDTVYVLEANPRASRTVPLVSKVCNIPMARLATELMLGKTLADLGLSPARYLGHYGVKEAVFPFNMFPEVDPVLGPEMRSTGEVLGLADSFGLAFYKAEEAAMQRLPEDGCVLFTVTDKDKPAALEVAKRFHQMGFSIRATAGTYRFFKENGLPCQPIDKMHEGRPNIVDAVKNGEIQLVVNTPSGRRSEHDDSYIRKAAVKYKIPYITTIAAAEAAARGIEAWRRGHGDVKSLQEYHAAIR